MISQLGAADPAWVNPWFQHQLALALVGTGQFDEADTVFRRAIEQLESHLPNAAPHLLQTWGESLTDRRSFARAQECFQRCLDVARRSGSPNLAEAVALNSLGVLELTRGDLGRA